MTDFSCKSSFNISFPVLGSGSDQLGSNPKFLVFDSQPRVNQSKLDVMNKTEERRKRKKNTKNKRMKQLKNLKQIKNNWKGNELFGRGEFRANQLDLFTSVKGIAQTALKIESLSFSFSNITRTLCCYMEGSNGHNIVQNLVQLSQKSVSRNWVRVYWLLLISANWSDLITSNWRNKNGENIQEQMNHPKIYTHREFLKGK